MWILIYCVLSALILYGFAHEETVVAFEDRIAEAVRRRRDRRHAERLRKRGYVVCELPEDCNKALVLRVRGE